MSEWQPIETAPPPTPYRHRDDELLRYLAYFPKGLYGDDAPEILIVWRVYDEDEWGFYGDQMAEVSPPTHWMPLPEPPK